MYETSIFVGKKKSKSIFSENIDSNNLSALNFKSFVIPPIFLSIFCAIFYWPSLSYKFQFDDLPNILKFYHIRDYNFQKLFLSGSRWISTWLNTLLYSVDKFNPFYYRLTNITFHIITSIFIYYILLLILNRTRSAILQKNSILIAFTTAILFAIHPVQTQTVSYVIQGQLEGLAGLFLTAIVLFFLIYCSTSNKFIKFASLALMFILGFLSTGTKEISIISPFLILLIDWFFVAQGSFKSLKSRAWLHLLFSTIVISMYIFFLKPSFFKNIFGLNLELTNNVGNILTDQNKILPLDFCISQFKVILHYMWIFVWPFSISADYDWKMVNSFWDFDAFIPFMSLFFLAIFIFKRLRKNSIDIISFCAIWFFIAILPRSSIIPSTELVADYKTYTASIGIFFLFSIFIILIFEKLKSKLSGYTEIAIILMVATFFGFTTYTRNKVWSSNKNFWADVIKHAPDKARAYNNYGIAVAEEKNHQEAILNFKKAVSLDDHYSDPWMNMAVSYFSILEVDKAIESVEKSLEINPHHLESLNNLGTFLIYKGDLEKAEKVLTLATEMNPNFGRAYLNLGRLYSIKLDESRAYLAFKKCCLEADFDNETGFTAYGNSCMKLNKFDEAIFAFEKSISASPQSMICYYNLARAYLFGRQPDKSFPIFQQISQKNPSDPFIWFYLGQNYISFKQYQQALYCFSRCEKLNGYLPCYLGIATCHLQLGNTKAAHDTIKYLLSKNPPANLRQKAEFLLKNKDSYQLF